MSTKEIDKAFYDLAVKERNLERTRRIRLERELKEARSKLRVALVKLGKLGVGALLVDDD